MRDYSYLEMKGYIGGVWLLLPSTCPWSVGMSSLPTAPSVQQVRLSCSSGQRNKGAVVLPMRIDSPKSRRHNAERK